MYPSWSAIYLQDGIH
jgi:hypothetical protein